MLALPRNSRYLSLYLILALGLFSTFFYYRTSIGQTIESTRTHYANKHLLKPANGTLGFGGLYVVSALGSPRRSHLEQQAAITELTLTIPRQIAWTDDDVRNFRPDNESE